jgi:hypothetical protein
VARTELMMSRGGFAGDDHEQLSMSEAVRWYAGTITERDAARLRQMAGSYQNDRLTKGTRGVVA